MTILWFFLSSLVQILKKSINVAHLSCVDRTELTWASIERFVILDVEFSVFFFLLLTLTKEKILIINYLVCFWVLWKIEVSYRDAAVYLLQMAMNHAMVSLNTNAYNFIKFYSIQIPLIHIWNHKKLKHTLTWVRFWIPSSTIYLYHKKL